MFGCLKDHPSYNSESIYHNIVTISKGNSIWFEIPRDLREPSLRQPIANYCKKIRFVMTRLKEYGFWF